VTKTWSFDSPEAQEFAGSRQAFTKSLLEALRRRTDLTTALDVGCGVGDFSKFLLDLGFRVVAVDGREENASEGKRRYPEITFITGDAEELRTAEMGTFDFVLCFGLLYHLENPFRALRKLHSLTDKVLLLESMCVPDTHSTMELLDEGIAENQGLNYIAYYPSESCLVKLLYRVGFPFVYRFKVLPTHELYVSSIWRKRKRTMLVASRTPLEAPNLSLAEEPVRKVTALTDPWTTTLGTVRDSAEYLLTSLVDLVGTRIPRFLGRPWEEKREILSWYLRRVRNRN
jgi:SAM-dependent methyltransferase